MVPLQTAAPEMTKQNRIWAIHFAFKIGDPFRRDKILLPQK